MQAVCSSNAAQSPARVKIDTALQLCYLMYNLLGLFAEREGHCIVPPTRVHVHAFSLSGDSAACK